MTVAEPKILIVDDDANLLESLSLRLRHEGYDVLTAMDGCRGLVRAQMESPDLLILDIHMPLGDGFSIQEGLQRMTGPWPPVIYLTGDKSLRSDLTAKKLGPIAVIHKPFDKDQFLDIVRRALVSSPGDKSAARSDQATPRDCAPSTGRCDGVGIGSSSEP